MTQEQIFVLITQINALTGIRTRDLRLRRQGHYQLGYRGRQNVLSSRESTSIQKLFRKFLPFSECSATRYEYLFLSLGCLYISKYI
jgi:hypothetical protein